MVAYNQKTRFLFGGKRVLVDINPEVKYTYAGQPVHTTVYNNVEAFTIFHGCKEADEIEAEMIAQGLEADPYHEYLVLHLDNGETATYRNSFADMFHI